MANIQKVKVNVTVEQYQGGGDSYDGESGGGSAIGEYLFYGFFALLAIWGIVELFGWLLIQIANVFRAVGEAFAAVNWGALFAGMLIVGVSIIAIIKLRRIKKESELMEIEREREIQARRNYNNRSETVLSPGQYDEVYPTALPEKKGEEYPIKKVYDLKRIKGGR